MVKLSPILYLCLLVPVSAKLRVTRQISFGAKKSYPSPPSPPSPPSFPSPQSPLSTPAPPSPPSSDSVFFFGSKKPTVSVEPEEISNNRGNSGAGEWQENTVSSGSGEWGPVVEDKTN